MILKVFKIFTYSVFKLVDKELFYCVEAFGRSIRNISFNKYTMLKVLVILIISVMLIHILLLYPAVCLCLDSSSLEAYKNMYLMRNPLLKMNGLRRLNTCKYQR